MKRWSCSIEVDVNFPAENEEAAWERAQEIADAMAVLLGGRKPPGYKRRSARVSNVTLNAEPDAVLEMG
jgi:hypothetical protein